MLTEQVRVSKYTEIHIVEDHKTVAEEIRDALRFKEEIVVHLHEDDRISSIIEGSGIADVFLIDVNLGPNKKRRGIEIIELLREEYKDSLIIAYSANQTKEKLESCIQAGADYFHEKSVGTWDDSMRNIRFAIEYHVKHFNRLVKNWTSVTYLYCYVKDIDLSTGKALLHCENSENRKTQIQKIVPIKKLVHSEPITFGKSILIIIFEGNDETLIKFMATEDDYYKSDDVEEVDLSDLDDSQIFNYSPE